MQRFKPTSITETCSTTGGVLIPLLFQYFINQDIFQVLLHPQDCRVPNIDCGNLDTHPPTHSIKQTLRKPNILFSNSYK